MISHEFAFHDAAMAAYFVRRVHMLLKDVATMRAEIRVWLLDAHDPPQTETILKLAKGSSATWAKAHAT